MREKEEIERGEKERERRKWVSGFEIQIYSIFDFSKKVSFLSVLRQTFDFQLKRLRNKLP